VEPSTPHADLASDLAVSKFTQDSPIKLTPSEPPCRGSAIFSAPGNISAALETAMFQKHLEEFAAAVSATTDAREYLTHWDSFIDRFTERAFLARFFLHSARKFGEGPLDGAASREIDHLRMLTRSAYAFQRLENDFLTQTWPFEFIGMQLEAINTVTMTIGSYPDVIRAFQSGRFSPEEHAQRRDNALEQLRKLADPLEYLRDNRNKQRLTSLHLDLPQEGIDFFTAYPQGEPEMDVKAVRKNADAFIALRRTLDAIFLQAGRNRGRETHLVIRWNDDRGTLLIEDKNPVSGAFHPFMDKMQYARLAELVKSMGPGSNLTMTKTVLDTTIGKIVLRLPHNLLPLEEARADEVAALANECFGGSHAASAAGEFDELDAFFSDFKTAAPAGTAIPSLPPTDQAVIVSGIYAAGVSPILKP
jgi:hypothetical protein